MCYSTQIYEYYYIYSIYYRNLTFFLNKIIISHLKSLIKITLTFKIL